MSDLVQNLRDPRYFGQEGMRASAADEIERLWGIIARIDAINDNLLHFNSEINAECDKVLRPELIG
jgi:hypothetical protein